MRDRGERRGRRGEGLCGVVVVVLVVVVVVVGGSWGGGSLGGCGVSACGCVRGAWKNVAYEFGFGGKLPSPSKLFLCVFIFQCVCNIFFSNFLC